MDGISQLTTRLGPWARSTAVSMERCEGLLQLVGGGVVRAVVIFPPGFWLAFDAVTDLEQAAILDGMELSIRLQFDADWRGQYAKDIPIGMSVVEGRELRVRPQ